MRSCSSTRRVSSASSASATLGGTCLTSTRAGDLRSGRAIVAEATREGSPWCAGPHSDTALASTGWRPSYPVRTTAAARKGGTRLASMRPGTLVVLEPGGGLTVSPTEGMVLWFGRDRPNVHICVGSDDAGVSRRHGALGVQLRVLVGTRPGRAAGPGRRHPGAPEGGRAGPAGRRPDLAARGGRRPTGRAPRARAGGRRGRAAAPQAGLGHGAGPLLPAGPGGAAGADGRRPARAPAPSRRDVAHLPARRPRNSSVLQPGVWAPRKVERLVKRVRERLAAQGVEGWCPSRAAPATTARTAGT